MKKGRVILNTVLSVVCVAAIAGAVFCSRQVKTIEEEYDAAAENVAQLTEKYASISRVEKKKPAQEAEQKTDDGANTGQVPATPAPEAPVSDYKLMIDFDGLNRECAFGSVVGWLYCDGTQINDPIAQCDDNNYYLHRLVNGEDNFSGTLYADFRCEPNFRGQNTIVYGHNMANGSKFGELVKYISDRNFLATHPTMLLTTPEKDYLVQIFSAFATVSNNSRIWEAKFDTQQAYQEHLTYLRNMNQMALTPDISVTTNDQIITMVTCAYDTDHSRTIVCGKLVEIS